MIYILALVFLIFISSLTVYLIRNQSKSETIGDDFEIIEE